MQKINPRNNILSNYTHVIHKTGRRITIFARLRQAKDGRYHWCYDRKDVEKRVAAQRCSEPGASFSYRLNGSLFDCTFPPFLASHRFFDTWQEAMWYGDYRNPENQLFNHGKVDAKLTMNAFTPENRALMGLIATSPQTDAPAERLDSVTHTLADKDLIF